jgi:GNT-I family
MTPPVIALTVHNRPGYLKPVLESWAMVRGISKADMIFRCEPGCDEAVALCEQVTFARKATTIVNREKYGVLANPWHALEAAFATGAPFAVIGEEDTPVSDDILEFFAWCQREYETDPQVTAVCAYQFDADPPVLGGPADVVRHPHFSPLVWGTWAGRWTEFFRPTWDFSYRLQGWDYNVNRMLKEQGRHIAMPACSRSQHIGKVGGTHCDEEFFPQTVSSTFREHFDPQDFTEADGGHIPSGETPRVPLKLNLGAGSVLEPGWANHDIVALPGIDWVFDLDTFPWPLEDGCASHIRAYDVFEHIWHPLPFMRECWRVLEDGGILDMQTVHHESPNYHRDPDHKRGSDEYSMDYWCPGTDLHGRYGAAYARGCHFAKLSATRTAGMDLAFILRKIT